jgi:hypothetical protein
MPGRWLKIPLLVAVAFAFTLLMIAGAVGKSGLPRAVTIFCACLMWPGVAITDEWLHVQVLGGPYFFSLSLAFNTLIYSVVFGLILWLVRRLREYRLSHRT